MSDGSRVLLTCESTRRCTVRVAVPFQPFRVGMQPRWDVARCQGRHPSLACRSHLQRNDHLREFASRDVIAGELVQLSQPDCVTRHVRRALLGPVKSGPFPLLETKGGMALSRTPARKGTEEHSQQGIGWTEDSRARSTGPATKPGQGSRHVVV